MRRACGRLLAATPRATVDRLTAGWTPHMGDKLVKLGGLMLADRERRVVCARAHAWPGQLPWRNGDAPADPTAPASMSSTLDELRWLDTVVTLPDDMLVKVDRASLHWGLEAHVSRCSIPRSSSGRGPAATMRSSIAEPASCRSAALLVDLPGRADAGAQTGVRSAACGVAPRTATHLG